MRLLSFHHLPLGSLPLSGCELECGVVAVEALVVVEVAVQLGLGALGGGGTAIGLVRVVPVALVEATRVLPVIFP